MSTILMGSPALLDGPYGSLTLPLPLSAYKTVLLIAGGIGVTPMLALLEDRKEKQWQQQEYPQKKWHGKWILLWSLRDECLLNACEQRLDGTGTKCVVHLTGEGSGGGGSGGGGSGGGGSGGGEAAHASVDTTNGSTTVLHGRRPDIASVCRRAVECSSGSGRTAILVCGPRSMMNSARVHVI